MVLLAMLSLCITSCSKDDDNINAPTEQEQQNKQEQTYLKTSDLNGVWSVSGSNGLYFI